MARWPGAEVERGTGRSNALLGLGAGITTVIGLPAAIVAWQSQESQALRAIRPASVEQIVALPLPTYGQGSDLLRVSPFPTFVWPAGRSARPVTLRLHVQGSLQRKRVRRRLGHSRPHL